ncbi:MAG: nucleoside monophosphate kinase [Candidatus Pacebacteria bacterium]|nr:nucleoside monophosphate kinase [Candidatus Paceibacterota bacterium]MBP9851218.1 nucleoside monophosphate kinase [Candidatus Paceibacterota bacterium]
MDKTKTFIFFGIAGAGKGTQMELLQNYITKLDGKEFVYAGTGAGFRKLVGSGLHVSKLIQTTLDEGRLMPDFFATSIVSDILINELDENKHLILDGYPRTLRQANEFIDMMSFFVRGEVDVIYIEISKEESLKRNLLRGRSDDTEEGLSKRYDEYVANVLPTIEYMEKQKGYTFHKVNGEHPIEEVHQAIISSLNIKS